MATNQETPPFAVPVDIAYDRKAAMDEVLTHMLHTHPVDYGAMADINCPVPRAIRAAFAREAWDWSIGVWMYGGGSIAPHRDMGCKAGGNELRHQSDDVARNSALWFPLYGDYDKTPFVMHRPDRHGPGQQLTHAGDVIVDRPMLIDMADNYLHSMDNRHGHIMWYCLNFDYPEKLLTSLRRVTDALV